MTTTTDAIEKEILLQAPVSRVWRALSNAEEFGSWFGVNLTGHTFVPGQAISTNFTLEGCENKIFNATIETMEPERLMTLRWHPGTGDPAEDYSAEPTTLVSFELSPAPGGTKLQLVESGFDSLPASRRDEALRMNNRGWDFQLGNIQNYVTGS